jgi:hypothetical protein
MIGGQADTPSWIEVTKFTIAGPADLFQYAVYAHRV